MNKAIKKAIKIVRGQKKLADLCGVKQPTVWRRLHGGGITFRYLKSIVESSGGEIKPHELNKDFEKYLFINMIFSQCRAKSNPKDTLMMMEKRELINQMLKHIQGGKSVAAAYLGMNEPKFNNRLYEHKGSRFFDIDEVECPSNAQSKLNAHI